MYRHNIFSIASVWLVLTQTFPPINLIFHISNSLKYTLFIVLTLLLFPRLFKRRTIKALFAYVLVITILHLSGNAFFDTINSVVTIPLVMMGGLLILEYTLCYDKDYIYTRRIIFTVIIANLIMTVLTIPELEIDPDIIRKTSNKNELFGTISFWLISYQTVHGLSLLFAPLAFYCHCLLKKSRKSFIICLVTTIILFYIVFRSNAATATLLSIVFLAIGAIVNIEHFDRRSIQQLSLIVIIGVIIVQPIVLVPALNTLQESMNPSGSGYERIELVKKDIEHGEVEGDWEKRQDLYETSFKLFLESPLTGTSKPTHISKHTWFIDRLALLGIFLFIPIVLIFLFNFRGVYRNLIHTKVIYSCSFLCLLILLFMKNDFAQGTWLYGFAYLPLLCRFIDNELDKGNKRTLRKKILRR